MFQMILVGIGCVRLLRFHFLLSSRCVPWFNWFGLALVRFLEDCSARGVVGSRVLEPLWSSGWLFPTLVCLIAGHSVL